MGHWRLSPEHRQKAGTDVCSQTGHTSLPYLLRQSYSPCRLWRVNRFESWSQWPRGLRSAAARLLRSWVRIPPGAWVFVVSVMCCQVEISATSWSLVQRSPTDCDAVVVCDLETSKMRRPWPALGRSENRKKKSLRNITNATYDSELTGIFTKAGPSGRAV